MVNYTGVTVELALLRPTIALHDLASTLGWSSSRANAEPPSQLCFHREARSAAVLDSRNTSIISGRGSRDRFPHIDGIPVPGSLEPQSPVRVQPPSPAASTKSSASFLHQSSQPGQLLRREERRRPCIALSPPRVPGRGFRM